MDSELIRRVSCMYNIEASSGNVLVSILTEPPLIDTTIQDKVWLANSSQVLALRSLGEILDEVWHPKISTNRSPQQSTTQRTDRVLNVDSSKALDAASRPEATKAPVGHPILAWNRPAQQSLAQQSTKQPRRLEEPAAAVALTEREKQVVAYSNHLRYLASFTSSGSSSPERSSEL